MRILYLSCHSVLEYDELKLFQELGHYIFSPGDYVTPGTPDDPVMRPGLMNMQQDPEDLRHWRAIPGRDDSERKSRIPASFVERFDVVIVMHFGDWIANNWPNLSRRRVVWRTIGQCIRNNERQLKAHRRAGMKIVRYSPKEFTIPCFIGADAIIRFYKDPLEFCGWEGGDPRVLTVNQAIKIRSLACNYPVWDRVTSTLPHRLLGPNNDGVHGWDGKVGFEEIKRSMRTHDCYFYVGTHPASYTLNFIEAWMTGIPIVALGKRLGNARYFRGHDLYEVSELIKDGINGYISDDPRELWAYIAELQANANVREKMSEYGRKAAIRIFGKETIKLQWKSFLDSL